MSPSCVGWYIETITLALVCHLSIVNIVIQLFTDTHVNQSQGYIYMTKQASTLHLFDRRMWWGHLSLSLFTPSPWEHEGHGRVQGSLIGQTMEEELETPWMLVLVGVPLMALKMPSEWESVFLDPYSTAMIWRWRKKFIHQSHIWKKTWLTLSHL